MNNTYHKSVPRKGNWWICTGRDAAALGWVYVDGTGAPALPQNADHELSWVLAARKGSQTLRTLVSLILIEIVPKLL